MGQVNHNKLIIQAAREVLKPLGLFQKGQSRTWIDDNGWFLIMVEFQPSNWEKGTYLNAGIHYLWGKKDYLSFDFGHRAKSFISFEDGNTDFFVAVKKLAEYGADKVLEYRAFQELEYAKKMILQRSGYTSDSNELYDKMMICGLSGDGEGAERYFTKLFTLIKDSTMSYDIKYREELSEKIRPLLNREAELKEYVKTCILEQRQFWHTKSSMKRLPEDLVLAL